MEDVLGAWSTRAADRARAAWLFSPVSVEDFAQRYYERAPLYVQRSDPSYYARYFSLDEFERIMCGCELRSSDVKIVKEGSGVRPETYLFPSRKNGKDDKPTDVVEPDRLSALLASGCSFVLDRASKFSPPLAALCRELEVFFRCHINPNVYFTPPNSQGFAVHYDTHDTAIIQVAGTKRWRIYNSAVDLALEEQAFNKKLHPVGDVELEIVMEPGDFLYLPRGVLHEARSTDEVSLHVTLGLYPALWLFVLRDVLNAAADECVALRKTSDASSDDEIAALIQQLFTPEAFAQARARMADRYISDRRNQLTGQIAQMLALKNLCEDSLVTMRPTMLYRVESDEKSTKVHYSGKSLTFGPGAAALIAELAGVSAVRVSALLKHDTNALNIVRRLIQEGFALQTSPDSAGVAVA